MSEDVKERLYKIREVLNLSQRDMALSAKVSLSGWQKIESGGAMPGGKILQSLTKLGFNPAWILTGRGSMRLDDSARQMFDVSFEQPEKTREGFSNKGFSEDQKSLKEADTELMPRILEAVSNVYKELNIRVSIRVLAELASHKHNEIIAASTDATEWPGMIKLIALQLKKELLQSTPPEGYRPNQNKDTT